MAVPLALFAAGSALSIYGNYKSALAQADNLRQESFFKEEQAAEILDRNSLNNELLFEKASAVLGVQQAQIAGSGKAQSATTQALLKDTINTASEEAIRNTRESEWNARMLKIQAESQRSAADQVEDAAAIGALGGGLSAGATGIKTFG